MPLPGRDPASSSIRLSSSFVRLCSRELIGKWPDAEVIADVAPQPVEALRLDHQKEDDQAAKDNEAQIGDHVQQVSAREEQPAELLEEQARHDRQQSDEDRAQHRT